MFINSLKVANSYVNINIYEKYIFQNKKIISKKSGIFVIVFSFAYLFSV